MHTQKLTKIVATIGPASESEETMDNLLDAGVNVFRFNTKHANPEWHDLHIRQLQRIANQKNVTIGILLDLQGPELRLETRDKLDVKVSVHQELKIGASFGEGIDVIIPHTQIYRLVKSGQELLIDDGFVETQVVKMAPDHLIVRVENDSVIKHRKGVNLPGVEIDFPALIENDIKQLDVNSSNKVDFVGLSFVRSAHDIELLRSELLKREMKTQIVAKIESQPALDRLDEIIHSADVVMVARGDLGVEVPYEQLAYWQRVIIDKCRRAGKPVITATQMLESMIISPRPTRAEVTDVAHAIFEGTDALMLSGESASGKYPVRAVATMARIAHWNEHRLPVHKLDFVENDPTNTIAGAVASIVRSNVTPRITSVLVFTETGYTARALAKYRLGVPIHTVTASRPVAESLTVSFGIQPVVMDLPVGQFKSPKIILADLIKKKLLQPGETVVIVHGSHWQLPGNTNSLSIISL